MRKFLHVDMDAFYASVEQRDDPALRGRPVVVGGSPTGRGVVAAASYEARRYGIHSAMPAARAARLCPDLVFVSGRFARYREVSAQMHAIFSDYTDSIEPVSLDEAYLDVSDNKAGLPYASQVAAQIRQRIREELDLTASAGVAPVKFAAKIASDFHKPNGLTTTLVGGASSLELLEAHSPVPRSTPGPVSPSHRRRGSVLGRSEVERVHGPGRDQPVAISKGNPIRQHPISPLPPPAFIDTLEEIRTRELSRMKT